VERACGGLGVDLVLTDPPYGVSYEGGRITNDDLRGGALRSLLAGAFTAMRAVMKPGAPFYIFAPTGPSQTEYRLALIDAGLQLRQDLAWVKQSLVRGRLDYQKRHESILGGDVDPDPVELEVALYGWADGKHLWRGGRTQTSVWEYAKPRASADHPTMKPVEMLEYAILNSSPAGGLVLDLFAGSGSTGIACHGTNRRAGMVELDARYADVICRRYQEHTGTQPIKAGRKRGTDFTR